MRFLSSTGPIWRGSDSFLNGFSTREYLLLEFLPPFMRKANDWQALMTKTGTVLILSSACGGIRRERAKGTSSYTRRIIALQGFSLKAHSREMLPPSCFHE